MAGPNLHGDPMAWTVPAGMPRDDVPKPSAGAVSGGFVALYTLAQIGAFIAFIPMFNLLLPLKAEAVDLSGKAILLSQVTVLGAVVAGLANLGAGVLSDATRGPWGRRRPWIAGGAVAAGHQLRPVAT